MAKYTKKRVDHICSLIRKDAYTIAEICTLSGICKDTYYQWLESKPEFSDAIEKARAEYDEMVVREAKNSLIKKIKGYTVQETKTVMVDSGKPGPDGKTTPKIKERTVIDKTFQPDTTAIIFALTNKAPEEYKNRVNNELTGKGGKPLIPARILTKKEARELLQQLEDEC